MDTEKGFEPTIVRTANTVTSFLLFALTATGCSINLPGGLSEDPQELLNNSTPIDPELAQKYRDLIKESVGKQCEIPEVGFRSIKRPKVFLKRFRVEGYMIPPLTEGELANVILPTLSEHDPVVTQTAKELGVSRDEYKKGQDNVTVVHEAIHLCSPFETVDKKGPNPVIVDFTKSEVQKDRKGAYKVSFKVSRLEGAPFSGLSLKVEESKVYSDGTVVVTQEFQEEGNTEELITHTLTSIRVLEKYGSNSLEDKLADGQAYPTGRLVLTNIFTAGGANFDELTYAKQKNDAKGIFGMVKRGVDEVGRRAGIVKKMPGEGYSDFQLYIFLTKLSTDRAAKNNINPNTLVDYLSNYFFGRDYNKIGSQEGDQIASVYSQIFQ